MSEETATTQIKLIAQILDRFITSDDSFVPHFSFGADVGKCRYCGAVGSVQAGLKIVYPHSPVCVFTLNAELQHSIQSQERETGHEHQR
jgi:hypothetical protein